MEKLRRLDLSEVMISDLLNKRYWFLDQDILNKYFLGDVVYLDPRWNSVNSVQNIYQGLPATYIAELKTTETDPKIIHYAGFETKPWNNRYAELAEYYFYYLRQTFWYEPVMFALERREQGNGTTSAPPGRGIFWRIGQKCWKMMPLFARRRLNRVKEYLKRKL